MLILLPEQSQMYITHSIMRLFFYPALSICEFGQRHVKYDDMLTSPTGILHAMFTHPEKHIGGTTSIQSITPKTFAK